MSWSQLFAYRFEQRWKVASSSPKGPQPASLRYDASLGLDQSTGVLIGRMWEERSCRLVITRSRETGQHRTGFFKNSQPRTVSIWCRNVSLILRAFESSDEWKVRNEAGGSGMPMCGHKRRRSLVGLRGRGLWMSGRLSTVWFWRFKDAQTDAHLRSRGHGSVIKMKVAHKRFPTANDAVETQVCYQHRSIFNTKRGTDAGRTPTAATTGCACPVRLWPWTNTQNHILCS